MVIGVFVDKVPNWIYWDDLYVFIQKSSCSYIKQWVGFYFYLKTIKIFNLIERRREEILPLPDSHLIALELDMEGEKTRSKKALERSFPQSTCSIFLFNINP